MSELSTKDWLRITARTLYIQGTWNYERMLALGYTSCIIPLIEREFDSREQARDFLKQNLQFFNTHPYMASWIIGATIRMEEDGLNGSAINPVQKDRLKRRMSEFLGAIGDRLFWSLLKPLTALIGVAATFFSPGFGVIAFLVLYNVPHFYARIRGLARGYAKGFDVVKELSLRKYQLLGDRLLNAAAFVAGAAFVVFATSTEMAGATSKVAFTVSTISVAALLRIKVAMPATLLVSIAVSLLFGGLLK